MKLTKTLGAIALALATQFAHAQAWPAKSLTWIVPFAAGGPTDAMARDIADKVGKQIGQPIIVENLAGAGGTIGAANLHACDSIRAWIRQGLVAVFTL